MRVRDPTASVQHPAAYQEGVAEAEVLVLVLVLLNTEVLLDVTEALEELEVVELWDNVDVELAVDDFVVVIEDVELLNVVVILEELDAVELWDDGEEDVDVELVVDDAVVTSGFGTLLLYPYIFK